MVDSLLRIENLSTRFNLPSGPVHAVDGVSLEVRVGETLGLVGESGSGKSVTALSVLRLLPKTAAVTGGAIYLRTQSVLSLREDEMRRLRGTEIALIPQNPLGALNPVLSIGSQLREALRVHEHVSRREADMRAVEVLGKAGVPAPETQLDRYPHQFSGGMRQRVVIAMAIINQPALLIADEPTTALDSTTQAQILDLLEENIRAFQMGLLLITHDMGVVARIADRVAVMYRGEIVESGPVADVLHSPAHPYTTRLVSASGRDQHDPEVVVPEPGLPETGASTACRYRARCPIAEEVCATHPALVSLRDHSVRCWIKQAAWQGECTEIGSGSDRER